MDPVATELFNALTEELERSKPRKAVLRSTWESLANLLGLKSATHLNEVIAKLFD